MLKYIRNIAFVALATYGAITVVGKAWYYIKVVRTVEHILQAQHVEFKF